MPEQRTVRLRRIGGDQVIEIPEGWEFAAGRVEIVKDGDRLIISPVPDGPPTAGSIDAPSAPA
jgi:virulence-associated protein VagC